MTKDTRKPEEVHAAFREMCEKVSNLTGLDNALNGSCTEPSMAQSFAEKKAKARKVAIQAFGLNPDESEANVNARLGGEAELAREEQTKYYADNLDHILGEIPDGNLEKNVLKIGPQKIGENRHDSIIKFHSDYLGYAQMLVDYKSGKPMDKGEESAIRIKMSVKKAQDRMKDQGIIARLETLGKKNEKDIAESLIYWAHKTHAYSESEGDREGILQEGMTELNSREKAVYSALSGAGYAKREYALTNLKKGAKNALKSKNPEAIQQQIGFAYQLSTAEDQTEELAEAA